MKRNYIFPSLTILSIAAATIFTACKRESAPPAPAPVYSWVEEFDTVANAVNERGWVIINNSRKIGSESWMQGAYAAGKKGMTGFPAASYSYSGQDFAICSFNAGDSLSTISAWLISPPTKMKNGDQIKFYTRTTANPANFPDRLQVRLNPTNNGINVGSGPLSRIDVATMVGDFSTLLLEINPNLIKTGTDSYPGTWTQYTITISGLAPTVVERRFAFRYFVTEGGTDAASINSDAIGLDKIEFISQ